MVGFLFLLIAARFATQNRYDRSDLIKRVERRSVSIPSLIDIHWRQLFSWGCILETSKVKIKFFVRIWSRWKFRSALEIVRELFQANSPRNVSEQFMLLFLTYEVCQRFSFECFIWAFWELPHDSQKPPNHGNINQIWKNWNKSTTVKRTIS